MSSKVRQTPHRLAKNDCQAKIKEELAKPSQAHTHKAQGKAKTPTSTGKPSGQANTSSGKQAAGKSKGQGGKKDGKVVSAKTNKSKKSLSKPKTDEDSELVDEASNDSSKKDRKTTPSNDSYESGKRTPRPSDDLNESVGSVGEELMECLSRGGSRKKKAMRSCTNCGTLSPVSRAKRCPNCGKNLFNKSPVYSRDVTCPKCNNLQKVGGTKSLINCEKCNALISWTCPDKESEGGEDVNEDTSEVDTKVDPTPEVDPVPVNNDMMSVGYGAYKGGCGTYTSEASTLGNRGEGTSQSTSDTGSYLELTGNKTSHETIRRIIKRKILSEEDLTEGGSSSKKPCLEINEREIIPGEDKVLSHPTDQVPRPPEDKGHGDLSLNIQVPHSQQSGSSTNIVSSPLLEYAQKISARLYIPPEITPLEIVRKRPRGGNTRSGKSASAKNKRSLAKETSVDSQPQSTPVTEGTPDPASLSHEPTGGPRPPQMEPHLPGPPPLVKSEETKASSTQHSQDSMATNPTIPPPLVSVSTKPYHDPTINSIRYTNTSSNKGSFYSSSPGQTLPNPIPSTSSVPPPLLVPASSAYNVLERNGSNIVTKNLYPTPIDYHSTSVPPLVQVDNRGSSVDVAHKRVIIDSRKTGELPTPPALLSVPFSPENDLKSANEVDKPMLEASETVMEDQVPVELAGHDHTPHKSKHMKRKQKIYLVNNIEDDDNEGIIYETVSKKKKKKKKKEKEKERMDREGGSHHHHSKSKSSKDKMDADNNKKSKKKKIRKDKKRDKTQEDGSVSVDEVEDGERGVAGDGASSQVDESVAEGSITSTVTSTTTQNEELMASESQDSTETTTENNPGSQTLMYSVKIKDCLFHQIIWGHYRMVLVLPNHQLNARTQTATPSATQQSEEGNTRSTATPTDSILSDLDTSRGSGRTLRSRSKRRKEDDPTEDTGDNLDTGTSAPPTSLSPDSSLSLPDSSKKKKKSSSKTTKVKTEKMDLDELAPPPSDTPTNQETRPPPNEQLPPALPSPSSLPSSCSIYELRNKVFHGFPPRTVHAFTYKYKIKTHRPPLYWIYVLKRLGGLPDNCHMCRLLDIKSLKHLCETHAVPFPPMVDDLMSDTPNLSNRKLIDLSSEDPKSFQQNPETLHMAVPYNSFHGFTQKQAAMLESSSRRSSVSGGQVLDDHPPPPSLLPVRECRKRKAYTEEKEEAIDELIGMEGEEDKRQEEEELSHDPSHDLMSHDPLHDLVSHDNKSKKKSKKSSKSNPGSPGDFQPPSSKPCSSSTGGGSDSGRKKPCPNCGYSMLRKSKKCVSCGKPFGVFTFGRRQCTNCNHINLARMTSCFRCGQSLDRAPTAIPKINEGNVFEHVDPTSGMVFTTSKAIVPAPLTKHDFRLGVKRKRRVTSLPQGPTATTGHSPNRPRPQHNEVCGDYDESPDEVFQEDIDSNCSPTHQLMDDNGKTSTSSSAHSGYRYGKIPWNDADLALVFTSSDTPKLCLQEVCTKVLRYHAKTDVFELVKSLNLQLEPGDGTLLRKLQALGLHPNRSPLCRLIATEDLFALMDALEEPVPDEVHQYLGGNMGIIEFTEGLLLSHTSSTSPSSNPPTTSKPVPNILGEDQNGFDSTLHEIEASDGQRLAMLRSWDGDHYMCLLEVWRKYFPEVNRSQLSSTIKRLDIETKIPTSQQTNLLRSAGIIQVRGAPGRLVKVNDMQRVLDDFGVMLRVDSKGPRSINNSDNHHQRHTRVTYNQSKSLPIQDRVYHKSNFGDLANCMSLLMDSVEQSSLEHMVEDNQDKLNQELHQIESTMQAQSTQGAILHNHLLYQRDLCTVLSDEIAFLTVTNHSMMAEMVRLSYTAKQALGEIDNLIDFNELLKVTTNH